MNIKTRTIQIPTIQIKNKLKSISQKVINIYNTFVRARIVAIRIEIKSKKVLGYNNYFLVYSFLNCEI